MNGKFIVFEGIDGAGKTTQVNLLANRLRAEGKQVVITAEPTGFEGGLRLREALSGKIKKSECEMAVMFVADRIEHNIHPLDTDLSMFVLPRPKFDILYRAYKRWPKFPHDVSLADKADRYPLFWGNCAPHRNIVVRQDNLYGQSNRWHIHNHHHPNNFYLFLLNHNAYYNPSGKNNALILLLNALGYYPPYYTVYKNHPMHRIYSTDIQFF